MLTLTRLHARFLLVLPRIEAYAKIFFCEIRCAAKRADRIADTIALAWKWFVELETRGKDASAFVVTIAAFAARAVRSGRRVAGMEKTRDVMNSRMQARLGYCVEKLPDISTLDGGVFSEALADNTVTPPPDAAAFRIDFPRWLGTLPRRDRRLAVALMTGEGTLDPARSFRVSPARVSQLRRELSQDWAQFHGAIGAEVA